jgi:catechol 2,3-dioxygenase-like lactoylglutathione lyase family enzyme
LKLLEGDLPSGRYKARDLGRQSNTVAGVRELRVALTVDDFEQAVRLYHDGLGLPVKFDWTTSQGRCVVLGAERATLELVDRAQAEFIDRVEVGQRVAGPVRLAFEVPEVETAGAALADHGAQPLNDAVLTPWGDRNLRLRAPDGMQITLFQLSAEGQAEE